MIDLSYLTEEEQSVIMTVLRRDADLKKAEEERIRKLGRTPASPQLNTELKNRTGEWFYEAKSLRHMDKIHGSEIILASMKQRTSLDGLLRTERCKTPSNRGSDIVAPPKPARSLEPPRPPPPPQEISNAARENLNSVVRSPRTQRHNPFNRASQIVVEPADDKDDMLTSGDPESSETEPVSPLKSRPAETSQPSGGSITSEGSSAGFRPVPKKRTFISRRTSGKSESNGVASDAPRGSGMVVPVPRRGLQRESSESSSQSYPKGQEEIPQISVSEVPDPAQPTKPLDEKSQQPLCHVSSPKRERNPPSLRDRPATSTRSDAFTDPETSQQSNGRHGDNGSIQDANRGNLSSAESATMQEVPSLPQSTVDPDPPESYYLNFIDKSDQQEQKKSNQKQAFQLSAQTASPTGDEEGFNAKVLDWFSRSTDSLDCLKTEEGPKSSKSSNRHVETSRLRGKESFRKDDGRTESVDDRGPKPDSVPAETPYAPISKWKGIHDESASNLGDDSEQKDSGPGLVMINNDSDNLKSAGGPQEAGQRGSDAKILCVAKLSPKPRILVQSDPQPDSVSQTGDASMRDELSKTIPAPQLDPDQDFGRLYGSRNLPNVDYKQGDAQTRRGSGEDLPSPKPKEDTSNKDITNPRGPAHPESTAEKIKQLKSFWEQERKRPSFYKPKALGDGKAARGTKLNKRYAKSEYDLTSIGKDSGSDEGDAERNHNFTVSPLNQKSSPRLGGGRTQFNNLREFWGDATSNGKGSKIPKRKEPISGQLSFPESKSDDPEIQSEKTRLAAVKSSPPLPRRLKSPHDRPPWSNVANEPPAESKKSSKEEKPTRSLNSGREIRSPKSRKDSLGNSSSRGNSLRRATSMFALSDANNLQIDVHSGSRKQRQGADKGLSQRRSAEEPETATPRARACVPRDFRHYLGMTDQSAVHSSLAPAPKDEGSGGKSGYQFELGGPVRASTPVNVEERHGRRSAKTSQRPLWASYNSSDAGQESSVSSMSETWSSGRNGSNRENDIEGQNAIRNALRRAEARPKTLAKSMEDITASLSPRQERRQDETADKRCLSDESSIPSPSSSLFSEPEHLKKMSKSVPSFLQKEDEDTDSTCEDIHLPGRPVTGRSLKNLTGSSSMASLSGSVMTMYSDFGNVEVQGNIQFSINYVQRLREFHIFVAQCQDLAAVDPKRGRSDPYVKSYLVPDKANLGKRKTSVKKKTLNPTFNEILRYRVRMEYLRTQTLILSVWHHDTFGRNSFLGEVDVDLAKWDFDHTQMNYLALKARTAPTLAPSHGRGEMRLAVRFLPEIVHSEVKDGPNTGELHIWVKECKNLPPIRPTIDPYVKCFVLPDTSRKSRQKTRVLRRTADPAFNHTMVYDGIRQGDLSEACVELTVWDRDRLASNLLGGLRIGVGSGRSYGAPVDWMDSTPYEAALWERMMATPNEWVEEQLPLRAFNCSKTHFK